MIFSELPRRILHSYLRDITVKWLRSCLETISKVFKIGGGKVGGVIDVSVYPCTCTEFYFVVPKSEQPFASKRDGSTGKDWGLIDSSVQLIQVNSTRHAWISTIRASVLVCCCIDDCSVTDWPIPDRSAINTREHYGPNLILIRSIAIATEIPITRSHGFGTWGVFKVGGSSQRCVPRLNK